MKEIKPKIKDRTFRLTNKTFKFPKADWGENFYTANYFVKTD